MTTLVASEQLWWYVARSGGIVALVLTGLAVVWGLLVSTKAMQGGPKPKWLLGMHRWLGGLSVSFTVVHVAALVLDTYVDFGWQEILIPFASNWQPGAVAWGVVAMYLLLAVQVSSLLMKRLPRRLWRAIHLTSWLVFWFGLVHGVTAGSDAGHPLYIATMGSMTILILWLTVTRLLRTKRQVRPTGAVSQQPAAHV